MITPNPITSHPDYPLVDIWQDGLNYFAKAHNEAGARFLKSQNVLVQIGQRKQLTPYGRDLLDNQLWEAIDLITHKLKEQAKHDALKSAKDTENARLRALFYKGYKGMVASHGWSGAYLKQAS